MRKGMMVQVLDLEEREFIKAFVIQVTEEGFYINKEVSETNFFMMEEEGISWFI